MAFEHKELAGVYDLGTEEMESLDGICESLFGTVCLDLAELIRVCDSTLGAEETEVICDIFGSAGLYVAAYEDLAAGKGADATAFKSFRVIGRKLDLCLEEVGCHLGSDLKNEVVAHSQVLIFAIASRITSYIFSVSRLTEMVCPSATSSYIL